MMWFGFIVLAMIILLVLSCFSSIQGEFYFSREKDNDQMVINVRALYGLFTYRYQVPIIQFKNWTEGFLVRSLRVKANQADVVDETKMNIDREKINQFYEQSKLILRSAVKLTDWMKDTLSHVELTKLRWDTRIGVGDAPKTAIASGIVWGIKTSVLAYISKIVQVKAKPEIQVAPQYNNPQFFTEICCNGQIRLGFILWAGMKLFARIVRVKGGLRTWQRILFSPNAKNPT
jgi:hypothetical protein